MRAALCLVAALGLAACDPGGASYSPKTVHAWPKSAKAKKACAAVKMPLSTAARRLDYWRCTGRTSAG